MRRFYSSFILFLIVVLLILLPAPGKAQIVPTNVQDSLALVDIYNSANGPNWAWKWDLSKRVREWHGVTFVSTPGLEGRVVRLGFDNNNMIGTIPSSIANLTALDRLSIWRSKIHGEIPASMGSMTNLTSLILSDNELTGKVPATLGNLTNLQFLHLDGNQLIGPVPETLGNLTNLLYLYMDGNQFNFEGPEAIYPMLSSTNKVFSTQQNLTIQNKKGTLSVSAGGTLGNNSYLWHNYDTRKDTTIVGDSTFTPLVQGNYIVTVTNSVIGNNFRLYSNALIYKKVNIYTTNPNPSFLNPNGTIKADAVYPLESSIKGAATDGVTKLVLTTASTVPVTFYLNNANEGSLSSLLQQDVKSTSITVTPISGRVSVIYTVPDGYGTIESKGGKTIEINARSSEGNEGSTKLLLVTPPVVLVHGMWSSPDVWTDNGFLQTLKNNGITAVTAANYSDFSSLTYAPNDNESIYGRIAVSGAILTSLLDYAKDSIAATQVDMVGHSLGGLMARSFSQQNEFVKIPNYNKGYIHKLITISTPHRGTPIGPELWQAKDNFVLQHISLTPWVVPVKLSFVFEFIGMPIGSVHRDFGIESSGVHSLGTTEPFKTYAVTANYLPTQILDYLALNTAMSLFLGKTFNTIFASRCDPNQVLPSDVIVPISSQRGYISADTLVLGTSHSTVVPIGNTTTGNPVIQNRVAELLLTNDTTRFSRGFPAPSQQPLDCNTAVQKIIPANNSSRTTGTSQNSRVSSINADGKFVEITSPVRGSTYQQKAGDNITLSFVTGNGMVPTESIFIIKGIGMLNIAGGAPFSTSLVLPPNTPLGNLNILLLSKDAEGNIYADTSHLLISPNGILDSITASPTPVYLDSSLRISKINVYGFFVNGADTSKENISNASTGTTYSSQKGETIFKVSADGRLAAVSPGTDTLIIRNNGLESKVAVIVNANFSFAVAYQNSIDFAAIADKTLDDDPFALSASALSGLPVEFAVISGPATLENGILYLTGTGTVTVQAQSIGNAIFGNAAPVSRSFMVTAAALPVSLVNFEARRRTKTEVNLSWQTETEQNNKGFEIERKLDNESSYKVVGFVKSKNINGAISNSRLSYEFTDINAYSGIAYYRLKQIDFDDKINYSPTKLIKGFGDVVNVMLWPNPSNGNLSVRMDGLNGKREAIITDMLGKTIRQFNMEWGKQVSIDNLNTGIYILTIKNALGANQDFKEKIIIIR